MVFIILAATAAGGGGGGSELPARSGRRFRDGRGRGASENKVRARATLFSEARRAWPRCATRRSVASGVGMGGRGGDRGEQHPALIMF